MRGRDVDLGLFYIIGGQWLISKLWHLVPISGFGYGFDAWQFVILPVAIGVLGGMGGAIAPGTARSSWRRSARTTCAPRAPRDCPEARVLFRHVLHNAPDSRC